MKPYTTVASAIFTLVAIVQLLRVGLGWEVIIDGFLVPTWISVVILIVAAVLAVMIRREARPK